MSDSIRVAVRIRPLIQRETDAAAKICWTNDDKTLQQKGGAGKFGTPYYFDRVFGVEESTDDVFTEIAVPIVEGAMLGFNGTIFAYGQTSSGKTFTMMGSEKQPGIIPCVVKEIFDTIECNPDREYLIRVSYLEIYNENVTDLLAGNNKPLEVREDTKGNVFVNNLKEEPVNNITQILQLMTNGEASRHVGTTNMNERSSRSHAIFSLIIESRIRDQDGAVMVSHLNLVDLAGSEKAKATGASGQRLMEGGFINKSLFILGNVISQLSEGSSFVSYRDSRLTRILQNSLGGNSKTAIICNISPAALEETHSSLRFATNAKRIKNKPIQNEVLSDEAMLQRYKKEIDLLKKKLEKTRNGKVQEENEVLQQQLADKEDMISRLTDLICVSSRIRPATPTMASGEAKRKRRETWCPGKTGRIVVPKIASFSDLDMPPPAKAGRSLPAFDEVEESPIHEVKFKLPLEESPEIERPELTVNMSRFSNEDPEVAHCGCQTEPYVDENNKESNVDPLILAVKDEKIQELTQQLHASREDVTTLNQIIDNKLAGEGERDGELQLEVFETREENRLLKEKLTEAEKNEVEHLEKLCAVQSELEDLRNGAKQSRPSMGGLELVNAQLEQLRRQLEEKNQEILGLERCLKEVRKEHSETVQLAEEALSDVNVLKNEMTAVQQERDHLQIQLEDFKMQMEKREDEFKETEEFLTYERDLKNDSIMCRQIGEDMVSDMQKDLIKLKAELADSQQKNMDLEKKLSASTSGLEDLKKKMKQAEQELVQLTNEKGDFDMSLELERGKHKRRIEELTAQLEEAYRENSELRATGGPVAEGHSLDMSLQAALAACGGPMTGGENLEASMQAANNLQVEQLNAQITELQEQLDRLMEEMQQVKADKETTDKLLEAKQEAISQNEEQICEYRESKDKLEVEISDLKTQMESIKAELQKSLEDKVLLQEEKENILQEKSSQQEQKGDEIDTELKNKLEEELSALKSQIESIKGELEKSNEERVLVQEEKEKLIQEKSVLEEQMTSNTETLEETRQEVSRLESRLHLLQNKIIKENEERDGQEKQRLEEALAALKETFEVQRAEDEEAAEKTLHEQILAIQEAAMQKLEEAKASLQNTESIDTDQMSTSEKDELIALHAEEKNRIEEEISALNDQITCMTSEFEKVTEEHVLIQEEREEAIKLKSELEEQKVAGLEAFEEARKEIVRLEEELEKLQLQLSSDSENLKAEEEERLNDALSKLREEFELERSREKQEAEDQLNQHIESIREEAMTKLEEAKAALQKTEQGSVSHSEDQIEWDAEEKRRLEEEVSTLKAQIENLQIELQKSTEEKDLSDQKNQLEEENSVLKQQLESLQSELEKSTEEKDLSDQKNQLEEENSALKQQLESLQIELQKSTEEKDLSDQMNQMEEENSTLKQQLESLQIELQKLTEEKDLSDQTNQLEEENSTLKQQLESLQIELQKLTTDSDVTVQRNQLEEENSTLKQQIENLLVESQKSGKDNDVTEQKNQLEEENTILKNEIERLQIELQKSTTETDVTELKTQLEEEISVLKEKIESLQMELKKLADGKDLIEKENEDIKKEMSDLEKQQGQDFETLEEANKEIARLEEELSQLNFKVEMEILDRDAGEEKRLEEALTKVKEEFESERLKEKEEAGKELQEQIASIREEAMQKLEEAKATLEKADPNESCLADQESQLLMYRSQLDELSSILKGKDLEIKSVNLKVSALEKNVEALQKEKGEDKHTIEGLYAEIETLQKGTLGIVTGVKEERDAAWNTIEKLNEELDRLTKLEEDFKQQEEELKQQEELNKVEIEQLKEELEHLKECVGEHEAELQKEQEHVTTLETRITELKTSLKEAEEAKEEAQTLRKFEEEVHKLQSEKEDLESKHAEKIQQLEAQLDKLQAANDVAPLQKQIKELKEYVASVEEERNESQKLIDALDNEIEEIKQGKNKSEKDLTEKVINLEVELNKLKSKTSEDQDNAGAQEKIKDLEESLKFMREERDEARDLIDAVDEEIEQVKQEKSDLEKKISSLEAELKNVKSNSAETGGKDTAALESEIKDLKESLDFMREERDEARNLIDTVDEEIEQVKQEKTEVEKRLSSFEAELQRGRPSREGSLEKEVHALQREVKKLQQLLKKTEEERDGAQRSKYLRGGTDAGSDNAAQEVLRLQQKLARTEMQLVKADSEKEKMKLLEEEIRSLKERINSQKIEIRRLQNQLSETSYVCPPKKPQPAAVGLSRPSEGIIGSVKVLTMESENAALQRRVKSLESEREKFMTEHKTVAKKLKDQQHMIDEYKMKIRNVASDERLRDLSNGASQVRPSQKTKKMLPVGDETFVPQDGVDYFRLLLGGEEEDKDVPEGLFQKDPRTEKDTEEPNACAHQ